MSEIKKDFSFMCENSNRNDSCAEYYLQIRNEFASMMNSLNLEKDNLIKELKEIIDSIKLIAERCSTGNNVEIFKAQVEGIIKKHLEKLEIDSYQLNELINFQRELEPDFSLVVTISNLPANNFKENLMILSNSIEE
ncbi:hypothetical protein ROZALSC1DRAFT_23814 [Rozella allomycis CSF55]|uniref:Uncharacterized protein n=1 Tax=Rozella allomycis (strain CSF55) TaxID=988480 RepID=A0A4P9YFA7_ROZAC|nr:hypothetical protein ROZALSC1DRAFT_23814 [Rozella allomycis CSF55]